MPNDLEKQGNGAGEVATEVGSGTIHACWKKYSADVEASDKTPETLKGLWDGYIAALKKTPRTISGCMEEYQAAIRALGSAAESPDVKSGLWKTYMALVKDYPMTPENLADAGWTVPERGDALGFSDSKRLFSTSQGHSSISTLNVSALPDSLTISSPNFVTPALSRRQVEAVSSSETRIAPPSLWLKTAKISDTLRFRINGQFPFEVPLEIDEGAEEGEVVDRLKTAVRAALQRAVEHIAVLKKRHEKGTAEPGPYRLAFNLASTESGEDAPKFEWKTSKDARFENGK